MGKSSKFWVDPTQNGRMTTTLDLRYNVCFISVDIRSLRIEYGSCTGSATYCIPNVDDNK